MKKIVSFMCLMLCLSGCGFDNMDKGLTALMNKDVSVAFDVLGYPSGKNESRGITVYYWSVNKSVVPVNCNCLIKLSANEDGKIINWQWSGGSCGCKDYNDKLGRYYATTRPK